MRFVLRRSCPLIAAIGGARGIDGKIVTLAAVVWIWLDGKKRLGQTRPGFAVLIIGCNGIRQASRGGARIGSEDFFRFGLERGRAFAVRLPVGLEEGFVAFGVSRNALV